MLEHCWASAAETLALLFRQLQQRHRRLRRQVAADGRQAEARRAQTQVGAKGELHLWTKALDLHQYFGHFKSCA